MVWVWPIAVWVVIRTGAGNDRFGGLGLGSTGTRVGDYGFRGVLDCRKKFRFPRAKATRGEPGIESREMKEGFGRQHGGNSRQHGLLEQKLEFTKGGRKEEEREETKHKSPIFKG